MSETCHNPPYARRKVVQVAVTPPVPWPNGSAVYRAGESSMPGKQPLGWLVYLRGNLYQVWQNKDGPKLVGTVAGQSEAMQALH